MDFKMILVENVDFSVRTHNALKKAGIETVGQMIMLDEEQVRSIRSIGEKSVEEVLNKIAEYKTFASSYSILDYAATREYRAGIVEFVQFNNDDLEYLNIHQRIKAKFNKAGFSKISEIIFMSHDELMEIPTMSEAAVVDTKNAIKQYLLANESKMVEYLEGDKSALWSNEKIISEILKLYNEKPFSRKEISEIKDELLKNGVLVEYGTLMDDINELVKNKKLEKCGMHYKRVYERFASYFDKCSSVDEKTKKVVKQSLSGVSYESIAQEKGLTRQRVRMIVKDAVDRVRKEYFTLNNTEYFIEDQYRYFYTTYEVDKEIAKQWLDMDSSIRRYLNIIDIERGTRPINEALEDENIDEALRAKISNYINRNCIFVDGSWVEKTISSLENIVIKKYAKEDVKIDELFLLYNEFLEAQGIANEGNLYITKENRRARAMNVCGSRYLLHKLGERIRYYDIDSKDYTKLITELKLTEYNSVKLSVEMFFNDNPELMKEYDIRDKYELHNLLKRVIADCPKDKTLFAIPKEAFENMRFGRNPMIIWE